MSQVQRRILIVDDEEDVGYAIKIVLEEYDFNVDFYSEPARALNEFRPNIYDAMILDIKMPKINGFELYNKLKSIDANIKTIFLTALNSVESYNTQRIEAYPKLGERHFVTKPISNNELLEQVYTITN